MIAPNVLATIRNQIAESVSLSELDDGRIGISLPLAYDDGDHFACYAIRDGSTWVLRDECDLVTRASYRDVNLLARGYVDRVRKIAEFYGAKAARDGNLEIPVRDNDFGSAVFSFAQTFLALQELAKTKPERQQAEPGVRFQKMVEAILEAKLPDGIVTPNWHDKDLDPHGVYGVDCYVKTSRTPWFVFSPSTPHHCLKAAITIQHYKRENVGFRSLAVCKDEKDLPAGSRIPLHDVADVWLPEFANGEPLEKLIDNDFS